MTTEEFWGKCRELNWKITGFQILKTYSHRRREKEKTEKLFLKKQQNSINFIIHLMETIPDDGPKKNLNDILKLVLDAVKTDIHFDL